MADWLRPVFARSKTPVPGIDRQSSFCVDNNNSEDSNMSRLRPASRVSSYMGVRSSTPPIPQTPDTFNNIRNPESVYHKPSVDHMAETLKVVMMNQSSVDPVPVVYNSCILHVLEAYQDLRAELTKKEDFIEELKLSHMRDITDFEALATQWQMREQDYKTELKKLEVLLSRTEGGMEKVTLARSKSALHGSAAADTIERGISIIKEKNAGRHSQSRGNSDSIEGTAQYRTAYSSFDVKQSFHPMVNPKPQLNPQARSNPASTLGKRPSTPFRTKVLQPRAPSSNLNLYTSPTRMDMVQQPIPERQVPSLTRSQLDALEQQHEEGEAGMAFDSSTSGPESSAHLIQDEMPHVEQPVGLGIDINEKPLPDIPSNPAPNGSGHTASELCVTRYPQFDTGSENLESLSQLGFSFKPGDDMDIIAQNSVRDRNKNELFGVATYQPRPTTSEEESEASYASTRIVGRARRPKSTSLSAKPKLQAKPGIAQEIQDNKSLKRDGSTSGIITAIRGNSGRNSVESSRNSSRSVQQRLNRSSSSNEAITAAVRALGSAPQTVRRSAPRKKGTRSGTREGGSRGEESLKIEQGDEESNDQRRKTSSVKSDT